ncbi:MAG: hypothetical protein Q9166_002605 [cf. Caloplaca sp. 2 TL-2023]
MQATWPTEISTLPLSFPPPSAPLPALPLEATVAQAPPSTPRNASHLYGEFSWPSLNIAALIERLEDLAEEEQGREIFEDFPAIVEGAAASRELCCEEQHVTEVNERSPPRLSERELKNRPIYEWLEGVYSDPNDSDNESLYFSCSDDGEANELDDVDDVDDAHEWLDREDWVELLRLLGWLEGFEGEAEDRLLGVNERRGRERRGGCVIGWSR